MCSILSMIWRNREYIPLSVHYYGELLLYMHAVVLVVSLVGGVAVLVFVSSPVVVILGIFPMITSMKSTHESVTFKHMQL